MRKGLAPGLARSSPRLDSTGAGRLQTTGRGLAWGDFINARRGLNLRSFPSPLRYAFASVSFSGIDGSSLPVLRLHPSIPFFGAWSVAESLAELSSVDSRVPGWVPPGGMAFSTLAVRIPAATELQRTYIKKRLDIPSYHCRTVDILKLDISNEHGIKVAT